MVPKDFIVDTLVETISFEIYCAGQRHVEINVFRYHAGKTSDFIDIIMFSESFFYKLILLAEVQFRVFMPLKVVLL